MTEQEHPTPPDAELAADAAPETAEELVWLSLDVQKAQRQIQRGMSELAEGIVSLAVALLEIRTRRLYRFDPDAECARSFAVFVTRRFQISERLARQYTDALATLGEAQYHALLRDYGAQRTFALALLHQADPALLAAFQQLPADERAAVPTPDIVALAERVTPADETALAQRVAQLEQELGRHQGWLQQSRQRVRDIEAMHQRMVQALLEERDGAQQDAERQQHEVQRLRNLLRQAQASRAAPPPPGALLPARGQEHVVVVLPVDVAALIEEVRAVRTKLAQFTQIPATEVPPEQRRALASSLQELVRVIATLEH